MVCGTGCDCRSSLKLLGELITAQRFDFEFIEVHFEFKPNSLELKFAAILAFVIAIASVHYLVRDHWPWSTLIVIAFKTFPQRDCETAAPIAAMS